MSRKSNVNPDHYVQAGRGRQGQDVVHEVERQKLKEKRCGCATRQGAEEGYKKEVKTGGAAWLRLNLTRPRLCRYRLHAPAPQSLTDGAFSAGESFVHRDFDRCVLRFENHTWQPAECDFDVAHLVDSALRTINILDADANALD